MEDPIRVREKQLKEKPPLKVVKGKRRANPYPPSLRRTAARTIEPSTGAST